MKTLNDQTISEIWASVEGAATGDKQEDYYPPYAIKRPKSVLVANKHMLFQWPIELVDFESRLLKKMFRKAPADSMLQHKSWKSLLIPREELFFDCEESDPTEDEVNEMAIDGPPGTIYYTHEGEGKRAAFNAAYHDMVLNLFTIEPFVQVYNDVHAKPELAALVISEANRRIGILANRCK